MLTVWTLNGFYFIFGTYSSPGIITTHSTYLQRLTWNRLSHQCSLICIAFQRVLHLPIMPTVPEDVRQPTETQHSNLPSLVKVSKLSLCVILNLLQEVLLLLQGVWISLRMYIWTMLRCLRLLFSTSALCDIILYVHIMILLGG